MTTTWSAWPPSLQSISAKGWLFAAPRISARPNSNINPMTSFGIMPAPGADRLPNGRSPLNANTARPNRTKAAPATWSDLNVTNGTGWISSDCRGPSSHLADLTDRFLGTLDVLVPEFRELRRREIARLQATLASGSLNCGLAAALSM